MICCGKEEEEETKEKEKEKEKSYLEEKVAAPV
jgi:hypothetical protein